MLATDITETPISRGYVGILQEFTHIINTILDQLGYTWHDVAAIGVGAPAFIDQHQHVILHAPNIGWRNVPLENDLRALWGKSVFVENDANTAAIGEVWQGAGQGAGEILYVTIGTGVGGGIVINGSIYHGFLGIAGEIGHISIPGSKRRKCNCGRRGCLETEVSSLAIEREAIAYAQKSGKGVLHEELQRQGTIQARFVIEQALAGDQDSQAILAGMGKILGMVLADLAIILNPRKIIIGGGVSAAGAWILDPVKASFQDCGSELIRSQTEIILATLGNRAGMVGAARLAIINAATTK